jgi:hypothetical protein
MINTYDIKTYDDLPLLPNSRGYVNSYGTKVYYTFIDRSSLRGSSTTLV